MKNTLKILSAKIRVLIGIKYDKTIIPEGLYCYEYDAKKTDALVDEWDNGFYIKTCPYHLKVTDNYYCCLYEGKLTKDDNFKEKNKICNIKNK